VLHLTVLNLQRVERDLRASMEAIGTLRGLIPVWSCSREIRNDQGSWQQVEAQVSEHSAAPFSHRIRPRCMAEHHPEEVTLG
jgi:hypothetical protein